MTVRITYNEYPLKYDAQQGSFTVGNVITGVTSGATATIRRIERTGSDTGILYLQSITGSFQDNEIIYVASYGSELLTDGDMETDPTNNFSATNATLAEEAGSPQGGSRALKITLTNDSGRAYQNIATTENYFYILTGYTKGDAGGDHRLFLYYSGITPPAYTSETSWTAKTHIIQAPSGQVAVWIQGQDNTDVIYGDTLSVKQITNAALANGTVQDPINIDIDMTRPGINPNFRQEFNQDSSWSGKKQTINKFGIQEYSVETVFSVANYYALLAWWSWARQGKLWAFTTDSTKTGNTTLDGTADAGQKTIPLTATTGFSANDICIIKTDSDDKFEVVTISSVSAGVSVTASANLKFNYVSDDIFRHLEYLPEVISLDSQFAPKRTGISNTSGKYYKTTIRFAEAK